MASEDPLCTWMEKFVLQAGKLRHRRDPGVQQNSTGLKLSNGLQATAQESLSLPGQYHIQSEHAPSQAGEVR